MKAENTVMSDEKLRDALAVEGFGKPLEIITAEDIWRLLEAQARISFRAGIKEVVEYAEMWGGYRLTESSKWQAKLKEWEVK